MLMCRARVVALVVVRRSRSARLHSGITAQVCAERDCRARHDTHFSFLKEYQSDP